MQLEIFMLWVFIWIIFLIMSMVEKRGVVFGFLAGLWILFLGIAINIDGISIQTGVNPSTGTFVYTAMAPPFSTYSLLCGLPFILLGFYITWLASTKTRANWRNRR